MYEKRIFVENHLLKYSKYRILRNLIKPSIYFGVETLMQRIQ